MASISLRKLLQPDPCAECGYDPAFHRFEKWSAMLDAFLNKTMRPLHVLSHGLSVPYGVLADYAMPFVARLLAGLGLASFVHTPDEHSSETAQCLWEEAKRRRIDMRELRFLGLPRRMFIASHMGRSIAFEGLPRPNRKQPSLDWIDDKSELKKRFSRIGFPVPRGEVCGSENQAIARFALLRAPVITKPHTGSGGRHTTTGIMNHADLRAGFYNAQKLSPWVIVEEELDGPVFRATLIGQKFAGVLRRDPPHVIGDGIRTVRELVEEENKNPLRNGPAFAKISTNVSGVDYNRIPAKGETVRFHFKVNWGVGGTSRDATDETHPDNKKLFEKIGEYLGDDIIGIDFMAPDISKSWKEQERCGVIECNSLPHIGNHHFPYTGPVRDVAGAVWDLAFPGSK